MTIPEDQYELLTRLFPAFITTDREGTVLCLYSIFPDLHRRISIGSHITDHFITRHYQPIPKTTDLMELNGNVTIESGIEGLSLKMFGMHLHDTEILWISSMVPNLKIKVSQLPKEINTYYQYDKLLEQLLSLNSVRLSLQDADNLYLKIAERNKEIQKASTHYKKVLESVNDVIFQTDDVGNWTFLNRSWESKMGFKVSESIGKPFFNFLHPDDVKKNEELFTPLIMRQKEYCSHKIRYITDTGLIKWMKVYAILIVDDQDRIQGTSGTLTDITAEVENKEKYRLLADNINDSVCLHNVDGSFSYVSPSIEMLSGYKPEELVGKNPYEFIHPDDIGKVIKAHETLLSGEDTYFTTYRFRSKNGNYNWYETNNRIIKDSRDQVINLITSSRIIDERMRAELNTLEAMEERRRLNDQKSKFISMASHEFRTPMTSIQMSTDVIGIHLQRVKDPATKEIARHLHIINKEIMRFEDIMNQILLIGKSENDNARLKKSKTCIGSISSRCSETAREIAGDERPVIITTSGDQRLVNVDSSHMVHIIDNLFSNALKFSRGRPAPELNIHFKKESFTLRLKDYGIGIPKAEQSQLFMSFYRASNAEHIKGTGLGLVIIKNLVHLHEGNIKIKSQENIGTEIEILIKG